MTLNATSRSEQVSPKEKKFSKQPTNISEASPGTASVSHDSPRSVTTNHLQLSQKRESPLKKKGTHSLFNRFLFMPKSKPSMKQHVSGNTSGRPVER